MTLPVLFARARAVDTLDGRADEQRTAESVAALLRERVPAAAGIGRLFARHGYEIALVGGSVRDVFLGQRPGDLDLITDAMPEQVLALVDGWADKVWTVGIAFGTVGLRRGDTVFEITTYRSEQFARTSRKPDVRYSRSLEEDLSRRDFTVNAMAARLPGYDFADPFGGFDALREKVLRTHGPPERSFGDDSLRILRAARFAAQLRFTVADDVRAAMTGQAGRLAEIVSAERITGELTKLMLTRDPALGVDVLVQTGVAMLRTEADEHHRHKGRLPAQPSPCCGRRSRSSRGMALTATRPSGWPRCCTTSASRRPGRCCRTAGSRSTCMRWPARRWPRRRLAALRFPNNLTEDVSRLVGLHLRFHGYGEGKRTDSAVRRYVRDAGPLLTRLHVLTRADCTTRNHAKVERLARAHDGLERRIAELSQQEELARIRPELDGH
jgi:poly(A) polymerase